MNAIEQKTAPQSEQPTPVAPVPTPLVYTVEETAAVLKISTKSVRRLLDRGFLSSSSALRKKLIPCAQVEAFLKATCAVPRQIG